MIKNTAIILTTLAATMLVGHSSADAAYDRTPPCKFEDGSGQARCVWDARHMGNGAGRSLLFTQGGEEIKVITHRRAHRLMTTNR